MFDSNGVNNCLFLLAKAICEKPEKGTKKIHSDTDTLEIKI